MVPPGLDASRVGRIVWSSAESSGARGPLASAEFVGIRDAALPGITVLAAYTDSESQLGGSDEPVATKRVSASFFEAFGFRAAAGRNFTAEDQAPGHERVAILSASLLERRPDLGLGRTVIVEGESHLVVGILPDGAWYPARGTDVWLPLLVSASGEPLPERVAAAFRLHEGASLDLLRTQLAALGPRLAGDDPGGRWRRLRPVTLEEEVSTRGGAGLVMLVSPALVVLLIACANVANLLLARAAGREPEMAVRAALGAGRWRLVTERLAESLTVALAGGAAGLGLAVVFVRLLRAWLGSARETQGLEGLIQLDTRAIGFAVLVTLAVPLLFGLVPAVKGSRPNLVAALQQGPGRRKPRRGPYGGRDLLVVVEIGLAVVLVVFAGMLTRFFQEMGNVRWGFDADRVIAVAMTSERRMSTDERLRLSSALLEKAREVPGVSTASVGSLHAPDLPRERNGHVEFEDCTDLEAAGAVPFHVGKEYFPTLGIRIVEGRPLSDADGASGLPVAVISARHVRRCWQGESALGRRLKITVGKNVEWATVVGVAPDAVTTRAISDLPQPVYLPWRPGQPDPPLLLVRTNGQSAAVARSLLDALRQVDPTMSATRMSRIDERFERQLSQTPLVLGLLAGFAAFSLLLGGLGVFAVTSYTVAERTREFGVRIALGASPSQVLRLVMRQATTVVLIGASVAIAGTLAVARATFHQLADLAMTDMPLWTGVALILALVAVGASLAPARRATRVQPVEALRQG
jgi:predicted permease